MSIIQRVITVYLDWDDMEEVNKRTGRDAFHEDNWCDLGTIEDCKIAQFIDDDEKLTLLQTGDANYIVFRLDN